MKKKTITAKNGIAGANGIYIFKNVDDFLNVIETLEKQYNKVKLNKGGLK